jgi:GH24 family phage-related lysozyme (muramidase)
MIDIRIKNIQKKLDVYITGYFDKVTCNKLGDLLEINVENFDFSNLKLEIQKKLGFKGKEVDGIFGINTVTKIEFYLKDKLPEIPNGAKMIVSKKSIQLIIDSEISSVSLYNKKYQYPTWPKSDSGITIGIGYDLGFANSNKLETDWGHLLDNNTLNSLKNVLGLKGQSAKNALNAHIKSLIIPYEKACEVFYTKSLTEYAKKTINIYPGIEQLPPDAQGALLSIVYNRGASIVGDRRIEMKNIVKLVAEKNLQEIANEIRSMKRLWINNPDTKGLVTRREKEAVLVENANYFLLPSEYIIV